MNAPLDKLHDFYQPPPPAWTPQTAGWYIVFTIVGLLLLWGVLHFIRGWTANRYRREALRELAAAPVDGISALLKRAALSAWPREKVAPLSGDAWLRFLSASGGDDSFRCSPGMHVEEIALTPSALSSEEEDALRKIAERWIRRHRVQA
jgi:hypothetical protein